MLTASVVIYNSKKSQIEDLFKSIEDSGNVSKLFVIDNAPAPENEAWFRNCSLSSIIEYIPHENTGYGSSHNIAIKKSIESGADYHVVLNPDIRFGCEVLPSLCGFMDKNPDAVYVLPKVVYPNGDLQYLCKLLPSPKDLVLRRFFPNSARTQKRNARYVLMDSGYNKIMNPPCLSGCFMFMRNSALRDNNIYFDDRYFMYFEDFDLIRRLHRVGKTVFYPDVTIIHDHAQESYKSFKMLRVHIKSAFRYFNKFGWFIDKERRNFNLQILSELGLK